MPTGRVKQSKLLHEKNAPSDSVETPPNHRTTTTADHRERSEVIPRAVSSHIDRAARAATKPGELSSDVLNRSTGPRHPLDVGIDGPQVDGQVAHRRSQRFVHLARLELVVFVDDSVP